MRAPETFLGLDLGTSGCRAAVVDGAGAVLGLATHPWPPGGALDPERWWAGVAAAVAGLDEGARRGVGGLAVAGTSGTVLIADGDGRPLGPALAYDDATAAGEGARVDALAPRDSPARGATGGPAKLLRLLAGASAEARGETQAGWVAGRLAARPGVTDEGSALKLGYDPFRGAWPGWLGRLGLGAERLPDVVPGGGLVGRLDPAVAAELGLPETAWVVAGATDGTAAAVAAGAAAAGDAVTVLGSTLVVKVVAPQPVFSAPHGIYSHRLGSCWLVGGASNAGGRVLARYFDDATLEALSRRIDPERETGLDYYPLPARGERFPVNDPELEPRLTPRPASDVTFLQGILEGMARIEAAGYRQLRELGAPPPHRVLSSGAGAGNPAWRAIRERALGVSVAPARHAEAAVGAALLARRAFAGG